MDNNNNDNDTKQDFILKLKELFKDKKNIAIAILAFLLLISFGSSPNSTTSTNKINELKSQIEELSSNNNELKSQLEESNSKNLELENNLKGLQEEKSKLEQENQQSEITKQEQVKEVKEVSTETETQTQSAQNDTSSANNTKSASEDISHTYILNKNTKVFHEAGCSSVSKMKDYNKEEYTGSRDYVINRGYKPCQRCSP